MAARLAKRWEWSVEDDGYDQVADAAGLVLAFSPNTGVVALRVADGRAELAWRHPRPAGEWIELVGTVGGPGRSQMFVAYQQAWSAPVLRALSAADGVAAWERELGQGIVHSAAADARWVYVHQGSRQGHRLRLFEAATGTELGGMELPAAITTLVTPDAGEGRVVFGAGTAVVEYDAVAGASRVLAADVLRPAGEQQLGSVIAAGERVYATDGSAVVAAIDRASGAGILWRQAASGQPELGEPIYDAGIDAVVVCGLDGSVLCLDAADGTIRWASRCQGPASAQVTGVPAVLSGAGGAFVVFPGVDEALYLADATTGEIHDRVAFAWPLEVALYARPGEVVVPHPLGVTAFAVRE